MSSTRWKTFATAWPSAITARSAHRARRPTCGGGCPSQPPTRWQLAALRCANLGHRTIVVSTDAAHSLGDSFDLPIGNEPVTLAPNLQAQEIDVLHQMERYWGTIQEWINSVLQWRGVNELVADEASIL